MEKLNNLLNFEIFAKINEKREKSIKEIEREEKQIEESVKKVKTDEEKQIEKAEKEKQRRITVLGYFEVLTGKEMSEEQYKEYIELFEIKKNYNTNILFFSKYFFNLNN